MAQVMFALFAERISIDRFNNVFDIHNVIEEVTIPEPSAALLAESRKQKKTLAAPWRFSLVIHWRRSDVRKAETTVRQRVQLITPDSRKLASADQEFTLRESTYARNIVSFEGLPILGEGTYRAVISIGLGKRWRRAGSASFEVKYAKAAQDLKTRLQ
jgi:hypothetical protein